MEISARRKVKSGCRTCKIRKVKCDEGRPACQRCISTGRPCDGYGIWGGGGNFYGSRERTIIPKKGCVDSKLVTCLPQFAGSDDDMLYFEWIKFRAMKKIPGVFSLAFWHTLVLQASLSEEAVLHAVLALSCVHKTGSMVIRNRKRRADDLGNPERFILSHYNKAIGHLQTHLEAKDKASLLVALIACAVFVCMELLRGHFITSISHLQNGLKMLKESNLLSSNHNRGLADDWIVEIFTRLQFQVAMFNQSHWHSCLFLSPSAPEPPVGAFHSINEAWGHLQRLLYRLCHLTNQARYKTILCNTSHIQDSALLLDRQRIQSELTEWLEAFEVSKAGLQRPDIHEFVCRLLSVYHTMAKIMASASLSLGDESIFDSYTEQFIHILDQSAHMWEARALSCQLPLPAGSDMDMAKSMVDIGWIPPLYYVALKCRFDRVRLQAIRLIESAAHREGLWDSNIAACVSRKVMEIEKSSSKNASNVSEDFPLGSTPSAQELSLPMIPAYQRIRELAVVLPNGPMDEVRLQYRQGYMSEQWKTISVPIRSCRELSTSMIQTK
ncbi:hypothetical protein CC78DRAFT_476496 [Lojkania enalia]|uniref:Zn(2)-C6 fungal-type domain-containing protein n=1 Tax=Lojkania enalia TaxID=147567 RepID=A0A9P4JYZ5_9PLEO|nr:hypothetical protein CC78DRAFT_476496 [Didymosphaeria enalia]